MNEQGVQRRRGVHGAAVAASLVLFVGEALRPGPAMSEMLAQAGMRSLWLRASEQALSASHHMRFDALVLDRAALAGAPAHAMARLRSALPCPLVFVGDASRRSDEDETIALERGAHAYLARPLAPRRLRAQLAALMRLHAPPVGDSNARPVPAARGAGWTLDRPGNRLRHSERAPIDLTDVQARLLQCLFDAAGRIVSRARLAAALPNGDLLDARTVDMHLHRLRGRLAAHGAAGLCIETVRGRGFALVRRDERLEGTAG